MLNALDYLAWRGDLTFLQSPVNEVDLFLFSQLATPDYTGILKDEKKGLPLSQVIDRYFELHPNDEESLGLLQSRFVLQFLKKAAGTARFRRVEMCRFELKIDQETSEQFQAVSFCLPTHEMIVSYRGTDDTIIGWKENCNMSVMERIPAQQDALDYLMKLVRDHPRRPFYLVGHSKGGNLALYSAAMMQPKYRKRLTAAYNFDGPGFTENFFRESGYDEVKSKLFTILSQYAIIGTLLMPAGKRIIVSSSIKGLYAHDGFYWGVEGTAFIREKKLSDDSLNFERSMKKTLSSLNMQERQQFVDDLFDSLLSTGAVTLTELKSKDIRTHLELIRRIGGAPVIQNFLRMLFENYIRPDKQA